MTGTYLGISAIEQGYLNTIPFFTNDDIPVFTYSATPEYNAALVETAYNIYLSPNTDMYAGSVIILTLD